MKEATNRAIRWAQAGLLTNALLVFVKLFAGIIGHSNALIADAVESSADIFTFEPSAYLILTSLPFFSYFTMAGPLGRGRATTTGAAGCCKLRLLQEC